MAPTVETSRSMPDEVLYGRSGFLAALLYLRTELGADTPPGLTHAMQTVTTNQLRPASHWSRALASDG